MAAPSVYLRDEVIAELGALPPHVLLALSKATKSAVTARGRALGYVDIMSLEALDSDGRFSSSWYQGTGGTFDSEEHRRLSHLCIGARKDREFPTYENRKFVAWTSIDVDADPSQDLPLSDARIEELVSQGSPCAFGNGRTATTDVDPEVRSATETRESPLLKYGAMQTDRVKAILEQVFDEQGGRFMLIPRKMCVYREGDHFTWHVDTPQTRPEYLGTMVVELPTASGREGGDLEIALKDPTQPIRLPPQPRDKAIAIAFQPFLRHRVTKVTRGARVSVAVDVYADRTVPGAQVSGATTGGLERMVESTATATATAPTHVTLPSSGVTDDRVAEIQLLANAVEAYRHRHPDADIGFVLRGDYGPEQDLNGLDRILREVLEDRGLKTTTAHVQFEGYHRDSDMRPNDTTNSVDVFEMTPDTAADTIRREMQAAPPIEREYREIEHESSHSDPHDELLYNVFDEPLGLINGGIRFFPFAGFESATLVWAKTLTCAAYTGNDSGITAYAMQYRSAVIMIPHTS
eukprot:m.215963 g.215963  ORF g.215963 m.215963 type:complete len:521 (-) comp28112_c0_seq1:107-1669(-)